MTDEQVQQWLRALAARNRELRRGRARRSARFPATGPGMIRRPPPEPEKEDPADEGSDRPPGRPVRDSQDPALPVPVRRAAARRRTDHRPR